MRLLLAVVAMSLLLVVPADAQTEIERARANVTNATEKLEQYLAELEETQERGNALAGRYWQVQSGVDKLDFEIAAIEDGLAELEGERVDLELRVKALALEQYVSRSEDLVVPNQATEADRAAVETLARLVVGSDNDALGDLAVLDAAQSEALDALQQARSDQAAQLIEVEATQAAMTTELERLAELGVSLDQELEVLEASLGALEQVEAERQAAAAEQLRIEQERERALAAAAAAAARQNATPAPVPTPVPTAVPTPLPTAVPNPQPAQEVEPTAVPNPQPAEAPTPVPTSVPNPQPAQPFPTATPGAATTAAPTPVPNPQPSKPVTPASGGIVCPLGGPFTHTDDFNAPRAVGGVHRANDLISAQGTLVLAASSGTIEHRNSSVGGMSAHLKGDNGDYYFYTHLSGYENVGAGRVAAGTVIGYVGMTGNAPIPHLHFEIHKGGYGNYSNPYGPVRVACFGS